MELNGVINIYKEKGYTSHDVIAVIKKNLRVKAGHTGTLDPDAQGVLPVCLGRSTRLAGFITDGNKAYRAVMRLGVKTDTYDMTGTIIKENPVNVSEDDIRNGVLKLIGPISQVPPMYSAVKINGKRLYEIARKGVEIERPAREVRIFSIDILSICIPFVKLDIVCGKGTYIRSLIDDLGEALGTGAAMESLVRTRSGDFSIENAVKLDKLIYEFKSGNIGEYLTAPDEILKSILCIKARPEAAKLIKNGNPLSGGMVYEASALKQGERYKLYNEKNVFIGVYEFNGTRLRPEIILSDLAGV